MQMPDVNVLIAAFRQDLPMHFIARDWLESTIESQELIAVSDTVATAFMRIITNRRIFAVPDDVATALAKIESVLEQPNVVMLGSGERFWSIFKQRTLSTAASGNLIADAAHAALATEHGATWVTFDRDFARFTELRWRLLSAK